MSTEEDVKGEGGHWRRSPPSSHFLEVLEPRRKKRKLERSSAVAEEEEQQEEDEAILLRLCEEEECKEERSGEEEECKEERSGEHDEENRVRGDGQGRVRGDGQGTLYNEREDVGALCVCNAYGSHEDVHEEAVAIDLKSSPASIIFSQGVGLAVLTQLATAEDQHLPTVVGADGQARPQVHFTTVRHGGVAISVRSSLVRALHHGGKGEFKLEGQQDTRVLGSYIWAKLRLNRPFCRMSSMRVMSVNLSMAPADFEAFVPMFAQKVLKAEIRVVSGMFGACLGWLLTRLRLQGIDVNVIAWCPHVRGDGQGSRQRDAKGTEVVLIPTYVLVIGPLQGAEVVTAPQTKEATKSSSVRGHGRGRSSSPPQFDPVPRGFPHLGLDETSAPEAPFEWWSTRWGFSRVMGRSPTEFMGMYPPAIKSESRTSA